MRQAISIAAVLLGAVPALAQGPAAVTVATITLRDVAPRFEYIGRIEAMQSVDLRARVQGFIRSVNFQEGQEVKEGDRLFIIEPDLYEAALNKAKASLLSAKATLTQTAKNLGRYLELRSHGNISQADVDLATAQRDTAEANVLAATADVRTAELNLGYTTIAAPITGRIGRAAITAGNLVDPSSGPLAHLVQLDPIRAVFSVSERDFISVRQSSGNATLQEIGAGFVPTLRLANGSEYPPQGSVEFVDNQVDPNTGTIAIRARFPNKEGLLLPGETVTALIRRNEARLVPVVPIAAVEESNEGKFVLIVDPADKIVVRPIKVSVQVDQDWVVEEGLTPGERVVVEGSQKVQPGMVVKPVEATR